LQSGGEKTITLLGIERENRIPQGGGGECQTQNWGRFGRLSVFTYRYRKIKNTVVNPGGKKEKGKKGIWKRTGPRMKLIGGGKCYRGVRGGGKEKSQEKHVAKGEQKGGGSQVNECGPREDILLSN